MANQWSKSIENTKSVYFLQISFKENELLQKYSEKLLFLRAVIRRHSVNKVL